MKNLPFHISVPFPSSRWVVGVSGGVDSLGLMVLLLEWLPNASLKLVAAHVNYGLRGLDSDRDEALVEAFCRERRIPFRKLKVKGLRGKAKGQGKSLQELARELRYRFFQKVAIREGAKGVVIAHHLEDQAETVLDRLIRGAGPRGLSGLREFHSLRFAPEDRPLKVWRPLLGYSKNSLRALLMERGIRWREDRSNLRDHYRRNQIRHKVIPFLSKWNPNLVENLARMGEIASAEDGWLENLAQDAVRRVVSKKRKDGRSFRADLFEKEPIALQRRLIRLLAEEIHPEARGLSFGRVQEALGVLIGGLQGPRDLGYGLRVGRHKDQGFLRRVESGALPKPPKIPRL